MKTPIVRSVVLVFVFFAAIACQNPIQKLNITSIEFFKSQYYQTRHDAISKQVGLAETIYFEIVDHFDALEQDVVNWPINCWLTEKTAGNKSKNVENLTKFVKDGCQRHDTSVIYYCPPNRSIRVGFSMLAAGIKEVKQWPLKYFYVRCQYVKCISSISKGNQTEYPKCIPVDHCTDRFKPKFDEKYFQLVKSSAPLQPIPKEPEEILLPSLPDSKLQKNRVKFDDESNEKTSDCDCSNEIKISLLTQKQYDGRITLPVVAALAFASFSVGVLLMAGLCWIGGGVQKGNIKDDHSKSRFPAVKFVPSSASNDSILNWSSNQSMAAYTSVVADSVQRQ